jgi:hypothetical protein
MSEAIVAARPAYPLGHPQGGHAPTPPVAITAWGACAGHAHRQGALRYVSLACDIAIALIA